MKQKQSFGKEKWEKLPIVEGSQEGGNMGVLVGASL